VFSVSLWWTANQKRSAYLEHAQPLRLRALRMH